MTALCSVSLRWVYQDAKKHALTAFQLREAALADSETVTWTILQRVQLIIREKQASGITSSRALAEHFAGVTLAQKSEKFSESFIDAALTVEARLLSLPGIRATLERCEGLDGPLNSIWKLEAIVHKARTAERISWVVNSLVDQLDMTYLEPGLLTVSLLKNPLAPLCLLKLDMKNHLLREFLDTKGFEPLAKTLALDILSSHEKVRAHIASYPRMHQPDMSVWGAKASPATMAFIMFAADIIYGDKYDTPLKNGVRWSKGADVVLTYGDVKEDCRSFTRSHYLCDTHAVARPASVILL